MKDIFSALLEQMETGGDAMLVTLVAHEGSVPRGTGSMMLLGERGRLCGTVGGGPGENTMTLLGLELLREKHCEMRMYTLGDPTAENGGACGGAVTAYFQYIASEDEAWRAAACALLERLARRECSWLALRLCGGAPSLLDGGELCRAYPVLSDECFVLPVKAGERAVIFGAGHCAQALAPLLASVGFSVTVYDDRPGLARREVFPSAQEVVCAPFDRIAEFCPLLPEDYIVVMSSGHTHDLCIQNQVLRADHAYVGMLGSRSKRAFVHGQLREYGIAQEMIDRVHTPVGLPIQAVTPAEIAVSIAGEMILVRAKRREKAKEA